MLSLMGPFRGRTCCSRWRSWVTRELRSADLGAVTEIVIGEDDGEHRFADRHGADADARVVPAFGRDLDLLAGAVDRAPRVENRRGRLYRKADDDRLAGRDAAENPAGIVGEKNGPPVIAHAHLVGIGLAGETCR